MASSGNKPTAVHFTLIFFVMISLIAGVMAYMNFNGMNEAEAKLATANNELSNQKKLAQERADDVQAMKTLLGILADDIRGKTGPNDATAVVPQIRSQMTANLGSLNAGTVQEMIQKARAELNNLMQERGTLQAQVSDLNARINSLQAQHQARVDAFQKQANDAEASLRTEISAKEEAIKSKDAEITQTRTTLSQVQADYDAFKDGAQKQIAALENERQKLIAINNRLNDRINEITKVNFENPDGVIEWVDYQSKLVWINLGSADILPVGTTFSVYTKAHHGVGRGAEDIKGAIEVTRVMDAHRAEARIVKDDPTQPMSKDDPIYTPLWSPGRREAIAVVGFIDLDGDGQSDRPFFHEKVSGAGAVIDVEIDDEGNKVGNGFTINTKFLVMAQLPDASQMTNEKEKKVALKILEENKKLGDEARVRGIRTISLNDFLSHIGYKPERRNWRPGEERPYTLKAGSHSTGTTETLGNRESAGTVSGAFKKRVGPAATSSGQTSKAFGGKK